METDEKFTIPEIKSIPGELFQSYAYEEAFILLGFKYCDNKYERIYSIGIESSVRRFVNPFYGLNQKQTGNGYNLFSLGGI